MTIRLGYSADKNNTFVLHKNQGKFSAGILLTGFATKPIPGAICDNALLRAINFTGAHLQKVLEALMGKKVEDMNYAKEVLTRQLHKLNDSVNYIGRNVGQGIYLSGVIVYIVHEDFLCLPFGGSHAYLWNGTQIAPLKNQMLQNPDLIYIYDALGGTNCLPIAFQQGTLPVGYHIVCCSHEPTPGMMEPILKMVAATNAQFVAEALYSDMEKLNAFSSELTTPLALLTFMQAPHFTGKEEPEQEPQPPEVNQGGVSNDQ